MSLISRLEASLGESRAGLTAPERLHLGSPAISPPPFPSGYQKESAVLGTRFTCDFEGGSCGWQDVSTSAYQWMPARAHISTWGAEPPFDHTQGTDKGKLFMGSILEVRTRGWESSALCRAEHCIGSVFLKI